MPLSFNFPTTFPIYPNPRLIEVATTCGLIRSRNRSVPCLVLMELTKMLAGVSTAESETVDFELANRRD